MKRIYALLSAIILSSVSYAQKYEIGVSGGIGFNTAPLAGSLEDYQVTASGANPCGSIHFMRVYTKWQYGLDISCMQLAYNQHIDDRYYFIDGHLIELHAGKVSSMLSNPAVLASLRVDRSFMIGKIKLHGGVSTGYVFLTNSHIARNPFIVNDPNAYSSPSGHGFSIGMQTAASYPVSKNLRIQTEISAKYTDILLRSDYYRLFILQATLGLCYSF